MRSMPPQYCAPAPFSPWRRADSITRLLTLSQEWNLRTKGAMKLCYMLKNK